MSEHGIVEATSGTPDFFVAFYVGLSDRYDMQYLDYGMPVFHRGFRSGGGAGRAATTYGRFRTRNPPSSWT